MTEEEKKLLLVADSHVLPGSGNEKEYFEMLDAISRTPHDVLFLGDNLDLWLAAHPRYESDAHRRFLEWCKEQTACRRVMFVEGNHEFYLVRHHADCFTSSSETTMQEQGILFFHGDLAQKRLGFHRCFRAFAKNAFGDTVMRWLPGGMAFTKFMKRLLCSKGTPRMSRIPFAQVDREMVRICKGHGVARAIMGHFHLGFTRQPADGIEYTVVPAWKLNREIGELSADGSLRVAHWRQMLEVK